MEHKKKDFSLSWFFGGFLDNKAITVFGDLIVGVEYFCIKQN